MDFDDHFEFLNNDYQREIFDFPIFHSTPSFSRAKQQPRAIDYPSINKHYGLLTFVNQQFPIIYRLMNESHYIPYIRFSYALHIFDHSSSKKSLMNIRNLPVIQMTPAEQVYYNQLSSFDDHSDWSHSQLLSVSILDGTLAIINAAQSFHFENDPSSTKWRETMDAIREETRNRWILNEQTVLMRIKETKENDSRCITSNVLAKRRSLFEERLDLSIIDEAGGFVQIDTYIYPFIRNPFDQQIYINLDDIRQNFVRPLSDVISYTNRNSAMFRAYELVLRQAQSNSEWNRIRHGGTNDLLKLLPTGRGIEKYFAEDLPLLPLQSLLHLFLTKDSNLNLQFVQLFETASIDEIELNYRNTLARQFIMTMKRQGGLFNDKTPCLVTSQFDRQVIWTPSESKTRRIMTDDERIYLNMILLYYGLGKYTLTKKKQWYLKEIDSNEKENIRLELLQ